MQTVHQTQALHVIGIELRTHNGEAQQTIPPFWQRFSAEAPLRTLPHRLSSDVLAVYTHFAHAGVDNAGPYSLVIGAEVAPETEVPAGMVRVVVPASQRALFTVPAGRHDLVGPAWQAIWERHELRKTYIADYERYGTDGAIGIFVGIA